MSRSLKKGPFCQPALLKRIQAMNENGEKKIVKTWSTPVPRPAAKRKESIRWKQKQF